MASPLWHRTEFGSGSCVLIIKMLDASFHRQLIWTPPLKLVPPRNKFFWTLSEIFVLTADQPHDKAVSLNFCVWKYQIFLNCSDLETLGSGKEREGEKVVVIRPRRRLPSVESDEESGPDYENIDEHLEKEGQKPFRRSDYINYTYPDSEEEDGGVVGKDRRPFVHMKTHPVMKRSQSADNLDEQARSHDSPKRKLTEQLLPSVHLKPGQEGFRPRNRAPPPPPPSLRHARERDKEKGKNKLPSARDKLLLGNPMPGSKARKPLFHPPPPPTYPPPPPTQPLPLSSHHLSPLS